MALNRLSKAVARPTTASLQGDKDFNPAPDGPAANDTCPRCQGKLIDPSGLGWCKACGYCKSLEDDKARAPIQIQPAPQKPSRLGLLEFFQLLAKAPSWAWTLAFGVALVFMVNYPPALNVAAGSFQRAVLATVELFFGLIMIFAAQVWALCVLAPNDDRLHFKDAIFSGRLWGLTLKKMPEMKQQVWLASWGFACILSAIFIIGDLSYWMNYLPKKAAPVVEQVD